MLLLVNVMALTTRTGLGGQMEESQIMNRATVSISGDELAMEILILGHVIIFQIKLGRHGKRDRTVNLIVISTTCSTMPKTGSALLTGPMATRVLDLMIAIQSGMINSGNGADHKDTLAYYKMFDCISEMFELFCNMMVRIQINTI